MYVLHAIVPYGHRYARGQTRPAPSHRCSNRYYKPE
ncbi:hypothetical protein IEO21_02811 [Rhodonia placenta]|uniref:Uncharacterized protein n=1 Tax=Rhodonia placenta TaxID=104341 RepID=A0A8H7P739_9APHY|nr:hypothetical protein IEO21_02811 [Postia placenta]